MFPSHGCSPRLFVSDPVQQSEVKPGEGRFSFKCTFVSRRAEIKSQRTRWKAKERSASVCFASHSYRQEDQF